MMTWILTGMFLLSLIFGVMNGRIEQVSTAAISECGKAVELVISLLGTMCLWSGLMKVADKAGLTAKLSKLFSPVMKVLFKGMNSCSPAAKAISMNVAANLLGLGNAATPLGIAAMKELEKESPLSTSATDNMIMFVVLNTASLQLIPTTTALLRLKAGSIAPMEILPAVWLTSAAAVISALFMAKLLGRIGGKRHGAV